mmetsp:Transcript_39626/g.92799  ORF Transcript_39626/g.92799 Transcript_39626/m.92799 type:complete len:266 (+) Transcript_39626:877-1674(+)
MDNREGEQKHRRPDGTLAVVVESELEVTGEENGPHHHQQHVPQQEEHSTDESGDSTIPVRRWLLVVASCWCRRHSGRCSADLPHHLQVLDVLLHRPRLVDHDPFLGGILAQVCHDGLLATRVNGDPLRNINGFSVHDDPSVLLLVVLGNFIHAQATRGRRGSSSSTTTTSACTNLPHHLQVLRVLLYSARLVDHVPLFRCILSNVRHDRLLATGMDWDPLRDINGLAIHDDPGILLLVVLRHLLQCHAWRPCICHRSCGGSRPRL